jgi:hypothetical protein
MTVENNIETFDMGEFSLSEASGDKKFPSDLLPPEINEKTATKPMVNQMMKEVVKTSSRKTDEEVNDHQSHVIMLSRYGQSKRFAEYLKSLGFNLTVTHLKKLETAELTELHTRVKTSIDNKNVSNFWEELTFGVIQTTEVFVNATTISQKLKIAGITEALRGDETFLDLLEQVELENQNLVYTSPYVRLVYSVVSSAMQCHAVNSMMEKRMGILNSQNQPTPEPAPEEVQEQEESKESDEEKYPEETKEAEKKTVDTPKDGILSFE